MEENLRAEEGARIGCPGCGSGLRYDIASGGMRCDNCGQSYPMEQVPDPSLNTPDGMMDATEYRCPQCGAVLHATQTSAASFCSFCGADVLLLQRYTRTRRPARIVPFRVTREQCEAAYRKRLKEAPYAPEALGRQETMEHFRPVYVPFWHYTGQTAGTVQGGGTRWRHDPRYEYEDKYTCDVTGSARVSGAIYDASSSFEDVTAMDLRFDTKNARPFHAGYLCGAYAETPDAPATVYDGELVKRAKSAWEKEFSKKANLTGAKVGFPQADFRVDTDMLLMPVWLLAHRSGKRVVYTAVNGDTGAIVCDTPVSNSRFGRLVVTATAALTILLVLLSFAVLLRPVLLAGVCAVLAAVAQRVVSNAHRELYNQKKRLNDRTWQLMHPDAKGEKPFARRGWYGPLLLALGAAGAGILGALMMTEGTNAFVASLVSDHSWLPPVLMGCALASFLRSGCRAEEPTDKLLYFAQLAIVAAMLLGAAVIVVDAVYYAAIIALMALTALSMVRLNRVHNEFVSRPAPFFGKEGQDNA